MPAILLRTWLSVTQLSSRLGSFLCARRTTIFALLFARNRRNVAQNGPVLPGSRKKCTKFAEDFKARTWKAYRFLDFVQLVTLTVAFFDGVSRTFTFLSTFRTMSFVLIFYGGFYQTKNKINEVNLWTSIEVEPSNEIQNRKIKKVSKCYFNLIFDCPAIILPTQKSQFNS